ncbi:uncharacterized protein LOC132555474 [Ylistrum balloti]|uniref:uncharacterized protein LOC132555474 n=1 Tax=Ylistrum balloti TaxID=509963 RepID=UPI00290590F1|nr:uncharacterized protein LOC132555474 [Ylistrum balloti]
MILSQIQNWEQKLLPRETERQQKTTPQMVVGDQRDKEQQPIVASTTAEAKHDSLAKRIEELQREVSKLQMRYDSKVAEIMENNKTVQQQRAIINGLEKETKEQHAMINTITREKQELLNRLSEVAGHKLRENNAAITDLSSAIRPTKIAELYKELYDNQWTDAFEELKDQGYPEITAIQILNNTVYDSFEFTSDLSRQYMEHLEFSTKILPYQKEGSQKAGGQNHQSHTAKTVPVRNLQHPAGNRITVEQKPIPTKVLSEECKDLLRQLRKTSAPAHVEEVQMCFIEGKKRKVPPNNQKAMNAFYKECAKVTWYMNVQTPPLSLTSSPARGTPFLTDLYTPYTQSGNMVDYVVWPACLLHENGPLLRKGVLQPFKSEEGVGVEKEKSKNALDGGQTR